MIQRGVTKTEFIWYTHFPSAANVVFLKMTKKRAAVAETFGLDIAALLQEMDAMDVITAP